MSRDAVLHENEEECGRKPGKGTVRTGVCTPLWGRIQDGVIPGVCG